MVLFDASLQNLNDNFSAGVIVRQGSGYTTDGSISYENNLLKYNINTTAGMRCVGNYTTQKIDFSQYDKIKVSGIGNNPRGSYPFTENILLFEISDSPYISYQDVSPWGELNVWDNRVEEAIFTRASGVDEVTVDVSDITGEWYIVMGVATQLQKKVTGYVGKIELITETGGGAGSGYIGNSLLSNKKMVGYNVPTSSAENTKTESVNDVSASPVSGKPKSGNGFARIKFLREVAQFRSIGLPLANRIVPAKFKPEYSYYYGREEVPTGEQYYDIEGATAITIQRGGGDSFTFGDLPACFGIYDPNSSNVVNWYLRKVNSSGASMLTNGANTGSFSPDGNYTFYVIAGGEPENPNGKGYFTVIRTTDWSNGWGGLAFSTDVMAQLRNYFTWG